MVPCEATEASDATGLDATGLLEKGRRVSAQSADSHHLVFLRTLRKVRSSEMCVAMFRPRRVMSRAQVDTAQ